jgi:hypothetical protein
MEKRKGWISDLDIVNDETLSLNAKGLAFIIFLSYHFNRKEAFRDPRSFITEIEKCCTDTEFNIENALEELIEYGLISFEEK